MNKKSHMVVYTLILSIIFTIPAFALSAIKIICNGKTVKTDVPPLVERGVTLVPIRVILENLGARVDYNSSTQKILITKNSLTLKLQIGSLSAYNNNKLTKLTVAPKIIQNRTLVPLRFISEALMASVNWNAQNQQVIITTSDNNSNGSVDTLSAQSAQNEQEIFNLVNQTRSQAGIGKLVWVDELAQLARAHSKDMAEHHFFDHISPTSGAPTDRSKAMGLPAVGENIAAGAFTPASVQEAWMNSPGHRENILNPDFHFIGVGNFFTADPSDSYSGKYFTQNFIAGDTFFTSPINNSVVNSSTITVIGYSVSATPKITVYKLSDDNHYTDSYNVSLHLNNAKFKQQVDLKLGKGTYALWASNYDVRKVVLK